MYPNIYNIDPSKIQNNTTSVFLQYHAALISKVLFNEKIPEKS